MSTDKKLEEQLLEIDRHCDTLLARRDWFWVFQTISLVALLLFLIPTASVVKHLVYQSLLEDSWPTNVAYTVASLSVLGYCFLGGMWLPTFWKTMREA